MIQKIELSAALNSLATQSNIDKVTGMLGSSAANISKADLATVVAGLLNPITYKGWTNNVDVNELQTGIVYCGAEMINGPVPSTCQIVTLGTGDRYQLAFPHGSGTSASVYLRRFKGSVWSAWKQMQFV